MALPPAKVNFGVIFLNTECFVSQIRRADLHETALHRRLWAGWAVVVHLGQRCPNKADDVLVVSRATTGSDRSHAQRLCRRCAEDGDPAAAPSAAEAAPLLSATC